jgi:hypothetical protein
MPQTTRKPRRPDARWIAVAVGLLTAATGCESLRLTGPLAPAPTTEARSSAAAAPKKPGKYWLRASQFVFYSDVPLEASDPLFKELEGLPEQVQRELKLPPGEQVIQVFLFETQDRYESYMRDRFPWLPVRRAYFIADQKRPGAADELQVFTWMGDHIRTDLRHELTHATMHGVLKGVPLWLDEGLAGFFEQPPGMDGVNPGHLKDIAAGPFQPDLARLEKFAQVRQMEKKEYQEAWAWAHFLLRDPRAKPVLVEYMAKLRDDGNPGPIQPRLREAVGDPNAALAEHLARTKVPAASPR